MMGERLKPVFLYSCHKSSAVGPGPFTQRLKGCTYVRTEGFRLKLTGPSDTSVTMSSRLAVAWLKPHGTMAGTQNTQRAVVNLCKCPLAKASLNPSETRQCLAVHLYLQEFGLVTRRCPQRADDSTLQAALPSGAGAASQSEHPSSRIHSGSRPQMLHCCLTCGEAPWTAVRTGGLCPLLERVVEGDTWQRHPPLLVQGLARGDSTRQVGTSGPLESIHGKAVRGRLWLGYPHLCSDPGFTKVWVPTLSSSS